LTIRVVIDPGVFISAVLVKGGFPDQIVQAWKLGRFELIVSEGLIDELSGVIRRPKFINRIADDEAAQLLELLTDATLCADPPLGAPLTDDADDDYLAALALSAGATHLVTGDHALQRWQSDDVAAVSPREFLEYLEES
jgi:uncharacterized protein